MTDLQTAAQRRSIWAAVPYKGPVGSKRRLGTLLAEEERAQLSRAMLEGVLDALLGSAAIERVLLVVPAGVQPIALRDPRLLLMSERENCHGPRLEGGLNPALRQAQREAEVGGADGLLIVPADLPMLDSADLDALLQRSIPRSMVIGPDRAGRGTNALLLSPPTAIDPTFGEDSFREHGRLASAAGLTRIVVEHPRLALDLDTPADVALLLANDRPSRAAHLLRELGIEGRLASPTPPQARSATI